MSLFVCWMVTTDFLLTRNHKFLRTAKCTGKVAHLPVIMISLFCPHLSIKPLCGTCLGHHSLVVDTRLLQIQAIRHAVKHAEYYTLVFSVSQCFIAIHDVTACNGLPYAWDLPSSRSLKQGVWEAQPADRSYSVL